jgi:hypothetical protein
MTSHSKAALFLLAISLCVPGLSAAAQRGVVTKPQKKKTQQPDPPPIPPYTPTPLEPLPLDQTPTVAPVVTYQDGKLSIVAHNCTLADVLKAIRKQTGADLDIPPGATERVVADLGPGTPRDVIADLLNGTHFNYVMVGTAADPSAVQSIALTPKSSGSETASSTAPNPARFPPHAAMSQPPVPPADADDPQPDPSEEASDQADDDQPPQPSEPNQQTPKTPEQLLQELQRQQQQLQQQQQQQSGQPAQPPGLFPNQPPTAQPNPNRPD